MQDNGINEKTNTIKDELVKKNNISEDIQSITTENFSKKKLSSREKRKLLNTLQKNKKNSDISKEQDKLSESGSKESKSNIRDRLKNDGTSNYWNFEYGNLEISKKITSSYSKANSIADKSLDDDTSLEEDVYNDFSQASKDLSENGIKKAFKNSSEFSSKSPLSEELNQISLKEQSGQDFSKIRKKLAQTILKKKSGNSSDTTDDVKNQVIKKTAAIAEEKFFAALAKIAASEPHIASGIIIVIVILMLLLALSTSCSVIIESVGNGIVSTTYMTDEKEIYDASVYYTKLEAEYQAEINKKIKKSEKSGDYDEVRYNIDSFGHNPEVLISYLSAQYPGWTFDLDLGTWFADIMMDLDYKTVKDVEKGLFKKQYSLDEKEYWEWHYPSAHAMFPIKWYVKEYTLINNALETVVEECMDTDTKEYYDLLREYRGNRAWFGSPVNYNWSSVVSNLCGYTLKGSTLFSKFSNTSNLTYKDDGSTVSSGTIVNLPENMGSKFTYMGWQTITLQTSAQYKLREEAGMNFDAEGFGVINNRYVVAVTSTYGSVGDYIDVYQSDGTVFPCIIGDIKNQNDLGCNKWGHQDGKVVLEFVVDKNSWYGGHTNPGTPGCHPEWGGKSIIKIVNIGTYQKGDPAPNGGIEEGIISSQLVDDLETDVTPHKGIDIAGTSQTKVYAIFDGTVVKTANSTVSIVDTNEEYQAIYDSIKNITVTEGQEIKIGDEIGTMSDNEILRNSQGGYISENSVGVPHLHLEIRSISENQQYNPYFYIDFGSGDAPQIIVEGNSAVGNMVAGNSETGNKVVELALSRVGYMYLWGGGHSEAEIRNPNSTRFDCSGLVCWAFCQADAYIGVHNTKSLATLGKPIEYSQMQAGDIILWSSNGSSSGIHHVAIYIGGGQIVEAPYDGQPISTRTVYDKNLIYTIRRLYSD